MRYGSPHSGLSEASDNMTIEAIASTFAGLAFLWMGREFMRSRDAILTINASLFGDRGLENRVESLAKRVHSVESEVVGIKLLSQSNDERLTRLENNQ